MRKFFGVLAAFIFALSIAQTANATDASWARRYLAYFGQTGGAYYIEVGEARKLVEQFGSLDPKVDYIEGGVTELGHFSREAAFNVVYGAFGGYLDGECLNRDFPDFGDLRGFAENAAAVLAGNGIIAGYEDGTLRPSQLVTRAEFCVLMYKTLKIMGIVD